MHGETVRFDESSRSSLSDQPVGPGGVAVALRQAAEAAGLDAPSELYNEALRFAGDGEHGRALDRLAMLLCLDPNDGEAHLLTAKIRVARQDWVSALESLDRARASGANVPMTLRSAVEEHLRSERAGADERRTALNGRDDGEIQALRQEARRLRSDNARLVGRVHDLGMEVRRWAWFTTGFAAVAGVFIMGNILFAGLGLFSASDAEIDAPVPAVASAATDPTPAPEGVSTPADPGGAAAASAAGSAATGTDAGGTSAVVTPPPSQTLATAAATALQDAPGLDGAALEVAVASGKASLSGTVQTHTQRKRAEDLIAAVPGVSEVDGSAIKVLSRTKGTTHTVVSGDSLSSIAYRYYGDASLAKTILKANPKTLKGRPNLAIGMELKVPAVD